MRARMNGLEARVLQYRILPVTPFQQNCTLLWCPGRPARRLDDPGGEVDPRLLKAVESEGLTLEKILLTHGHIDHAGGTAELARRAGVPIEALAAGGRMLA